MSTSAEKSSTPAWDALAAKELAELAVQCPKCGICGDYLPPRSYNGQIAYTSNDRLNKCSCCGLCESRAVTTEENYSGKQCVSAANQTIGFFTKDQREQHFKSVKDRVVTHGMKGRPCRACREHFVIQQSKK